MINTKEIFETLNMIENNNLDVRTITIGVSLLDCIDSNIIKSCEKMYNKIYDKCKNLVKIANTISKKYNIPIINKRIAVTPISILFNASGGDPILYAKTLDNIAKDINVDFIGGYSCLVSSGFSSKDKEFINSIPKALSTTTRVCSSVNIGTTKAGINLDAVDLMGTIIKQCAILTKDNNCIGATKLVVFCNAVDDNPFMAGAFHGLGQNDTTVNVGVSGPGVVCEAIKSLPKTASINEVRETIKKIAFKITRMGELVAKEASQLLNIPYGIVDLSLAPTPKVGDSVAHILEAMGIEQVGAYGTTATLAILNDAVKKGGIMASSKVGGLSGAFIPVSEDQGMIDAMISKSLTIEKLEAMTAVCSVGLDMIVIDGNTKEEVIGAILLDEASIGLINNKTTAIRIIPAIGKKVGDIIDYGGLFGKAPVIKINQKSPKILIKRGGQIPPPIHSLKN